MTKLVADKNGQVKLDQLKEPVEICSNKGRTLGICYPQPNGSRHGPAIKSDYSIEELKRLREEARHQKGKTWAEIKAKLEQMVKDEESGKL
jgi:hypothetical protein